MLKEEIIEQFTKRAYLYSSKEKYLLSLMDKYAHICGQEIEDDDLIIACDNALDHNGNMMAWYSKASLAEDMVVNVGDTVHAQEDNGDIHQAEIISINDNGVYMKLANNFAFGTVSAADGRLHYDIIKMDDAKTYHIIPQYEDRDLNYKEAIISSDINTVRKRAQFILSRLDNTFPVTMWSVRITRDGGEDIEVIDEYDN